MINLMQKRPFSTCSQGQTLPPMFTLPTGLPDPYKESSPAPSSSVLHLFEALIDINAQTLQELEAQGKRASDAYDDLKLQIEQLTSAPKISNWGHIEQHSQSPDRTQQFALQLVGFPNTPLYAKRKFEVAFKLIDRNGETAHWNKSLFCYISVLKMSPDAEEITTSRNGEVYAGKPIIRGEVAKVFYGQEVMRFPGLVFTDISSLFPQGRVNIVVRCVQSEDIKPLLIEGVRIKARKKHPDEVI